MKKLPTRLLTSALLLIVATPVFAKQSPHHATSTSSKDSWWVAMEAGGAFAVNPSDTTLISVMGQLEQDSYHSNGLGNSTQVGASMGYQFANSSKSMWLPFYRLGVAYDYFTQAKISGQIIQFPNDYNYDYSYKVSSHTVWLNQQLDIVDFHHLIPFVEVGLGVAFNSSGTYAETPSADNTQPRLDAAAFGNNTHTSFAWRVGAGVAYALNEQISLSVLYRYTDRGNAATNNSATGALTTSLISNDVLARIRYNFHF